MERGIVEYSSSCSSLTNNFENIDDLRKHLDSVELTKCDEIIFSIMGLSLANINTIISFLLVLLNIYFVGDYMDLYKGSELTTKKKFKKEEIIRVNHAGELGAQIFYNSQINFANKKLEEKARKISQEEKFIIFLKIKF